MKQLLFFVLCSVLFFSCTKSEEGVRLAGTWKLAEQNNAYTNGGDNQWTTISSSYIIRLNVDGTYEEAQPTQTETGNYQISSNNTLLFQSSGNSKTCSFQKIDANTLILNYGVREGVVMQKFLMIR